MCKISLRGDSGVQVVTNTDRVSLFVFDYTDGTFQGDVEVEMSPDTALELAQILVAHAFYTDDYQERMAGGGGGLEP